ncbi:MAG: Stp1/IreP family PP2C-type Ser/Thr phosphatase [Myxococcota bacterium]
MAGAARHETASLTDVGSVRAHNEDWCGEFTRGDGAHLLVLADGMGGHAGGATASHLVVETVGAEFARSEAPPPQLLEDALRAANEAVQRAADADPSLRGMGATSVALLLAANGGAFVAHVGDSRAYRLRAGRLEALTEDHSVVAELVRRGLLDPADAAHHPRRNEILRSVGVEPKVLVDVRAVDTVPGDRLLLCSDGLCGCVDDDAIAPALAAGSPAQAARALVALANANGGPDNVTVQVVAIAGAERAASRADASTDEIEVPPLPRTTAAPRVDPRVRSIAAATTVVTVLLVLATAWLLWQG